MLLFVWKVFKIIVAPFRRPRSHLSGGAYRSSRVILEMVAMGQLGYTPSIAGGAAACLAEWLQLMVPVRVCDCVGGFSILDS